MTWNAVAHAFEDPPAPGCSCNATVRAGMRSYDMLLTQSPVSKAPDGFLPFPRSCALHSVQSPSPEKKGADSSRCSLVRKPILNLTPVIPLRVRWCWRTTCCPHRTCWRSCGMGRYVPRPRQFRDPPGLNSALNARLFRDSSRVSSESYFVSASIARHALRPPPSLCSSEFAWMKTQRTCDKCYESNNQYRGPAQESLDMAV